LLVSKGTREKGEGTKIRMLQHIVTAKKGQKFSLSEWNFQHSLIKNKTKIPNIM